MLMKHYHNYSIKSRIKDNLNSKHCLTLHQLAGEGDIPRIPSTWDVGQVTGNDVTTHTPVAGVGFSCTLLRVYIRSNCVYIALITIPNVYYLQQGKGFGFRQSEGNPTIPYS